MRSSHSQSKAPIIITILVVLLILGGIFWWYSSRNKPEASSISPETASQLSEGLKSIQTQDEAFKNTREVKLVTSPEAGQAFTIIKPLAQLSADDQAKSKQALEGGTATTLEAFGMAKKDGEGQQARSLYNSGYFIYKIEGQLTQSSTQNVVKAKAQAEIATYNESNKNPDSPYTYSNGPVQSSGDIAIKTTSGETITLPLTKYEQTIKSKLNPDVQKKIIRVLGTAKLGERLLMVTMAVDDSTQFGHETTNLQAMADQIKLEVTK